MSNLSRRALLRTATIGLAVTGAAGWKLRADAQPTPANGDLAEYERYLDHEGLPRIAPSGRFEPTAGSAEGPFFSPGAPYRAKVSPPLEPGRVLVVTGRVWSHETRRPLAGAVLDVWHADHAGEYDNDDEPSERGPAAFKCRARLVTDETGYYEYETVQPGLYPGRTRHIHYIARAEGHRPLTTQMYFEGEEGNDADGLIRPSLICPIHEVAAPSGDATFDHCVFDIVLAA